MADIIGGTIIPNFVTSTWGGYGGEFPRADTCHNCAKPYREHVNDKCLFGSTNYVPVNRSVWEQRFNQWASGKQIEHVIRELAYTGTGGVE